MDAFELRAVAAVLNASLSTGVDCFVIDRHLVCT
jgi:hypothetical protein